MLSPSLNCARSSRTPAPDVTHITKASDVTHITKWSGNALLALRKKPEAVEPKSVR